MLNQLKQQSLGAGGEDYDEGTKRILKQLIEVTRVLMTRFYGYDDLYEPTVCTMIESRIIILLFIIFLILILMYYLLDILYKTDTIVIVLY